VRIMAPDGEAMRGHDANVVVADEARALTLEAGRALEAAARPAQLICPDRQLYVVSSAGTDASGWLMSWRDLGRALVDAGDTTGGVAYFEWARGDDDDPTDPATWTRAHPGIGEHIDADALAVDAATMDLVAFDNEFLGAWPSTLELEPVPRVAWAACADPTAAPVAPAGELLSWALEVAPDRSATSIVAAAPTGDGRVAAELVVYRAGTVGVADELERLVGEHGARAVWVDPSSPAGSLIGELERRRIPLHLVDGRRITAASAGLRDDLVAGVVAVRPHPALDAASAAAVRRRVGEAWAYARLEAVGDPGPLVALALAVFDAHA
jgi:hypothetical protein